MHRGHPILAVIEQRRALKPQERQRRAFGRVIVGHQHRRIDVDVAVFEHVEAEVRNRDRQREGWVHQDRGIADAGRAMAVGDAIVEPGVADIADLRSEHGSGPGLDHAALIAVENLDQRKAVALDIAIVDDQCGEIDHQHLVGLGDEHTRRIVAGAESIGIGDRRIVDRRDIEPDHARGRAAPIADGVAEADRSVDVFVCDKLEAAAGQFEDPPHRTAATDRFEADRIAIEIAVVGQKLGDRELERYVFHRSEDIGGSDGCTIGRSHVDLDVSGARSVGVVGDDIVEPGLAIEIVVGREYDHRTIVADRAVERVGHTQEADRVAIDVIVVGQQQRRSDRPRGVLDRGDSVFDRYRGIVERGDVDHGGAVGGAFAIIGDGVDEAIVARKCRDRGVDRERRSVAIEAATQGRGLHVGTHGAGLDDVERAQERQWDVARDRARRGIDCQPRRQDRAARQLGAPYRACGLGECCGNRDMAQFDHQRTVGRLE